MLLNLSHTRQYSRTIALVVVPVGVVEHFLLGGNVGVGLRGGELGSLACEIGGGESGWSLCFLLVVGASHELDGEDAEGEETGTDLDRSPLAWSEHGEHLEGSTSLLIGVVHALGELEIKTSDSVLSEVRGQLDVDGLSTIGQVPLWMVILILGVLGYSHDEGLALLEGIELEVLLHGVSVNVPTFSAASSDDVLDQVLVHLLELGFASLVELCVFLLKHSMGVVGNVSVEDFSGGVSFSLEGHKKTTAETSHSGFGCNNGTLAGDHHHVDYLFTYKITNIII